MLESSEIQDQVDQVGVQEFEEPKATLDLQDQLEARALRASKVQQEPLERQVISIARFD